MEVKFSLLKDKERSIKKEAIEELQYYCCPICKRNLSLVSENNGTAVEYSNWFECNSQGCHRWLYRYDIRFGQLKRINILDLTKAVNERIIGFIEMKEVK